MDPMNISSGTKDLNNILASLNKEGGFSVSLLTDEQGLAIASASEETTDSDTQSAVVAMVKKNVLQVGKRLSMAQAEEMMLHTVDGQRLIVRFFNANHHNLILAITVPNKSQSYRRLTSQAIADIRRVWSQYWE
jgi:predicted regulator of Ras-like GTPase activity (Roadblock/LC7/MglB family)